MNQDLRLFRPGLVPVLLTVLLTLILPGGAFAQKAAPAPTPPPAPEGKVVLNDRVRAVVDEDPILTSDVRRVIRLGLQERNPGEADVPFRRRVLDGLIEERLRFHEI